VWFGICLCGVSFSGLTDAKCGLMDLDFDLAQRGIHIFDLCGYELIAILTVSWER
jgi:hypothetical protein